MDLGDFEVGFGVKDIVRSIDFYRKLGFEMVKGSVEEGAVTLQNAQCRIALYQGHGVDPVFLNFREGEVHAIARELEGRGITFDTPAFFNAEGGAGALVKDPDGNVVYFCSHKGASRRH